VNYSLGGERIFFAKVGIKVRRGLLNRLEFVGYRVEEYYVESHLFLKSYNSTA
jgi:hypothetical protein